MLLSKILTHRSMSTSYIRDHHLIQSETSGTTSFNWWVLSQNKLIVNHHFHSHNWYYQVPSFHDLGVAPHSCRQRFLVLRCAARHKSPIVPCKSQEVAWKAMTNIAHKKRRQILWQRYQVFNFLSFQRWDAAQDLMLRHKPTNDMNHWRSDWWKATKLTAKIEREREILQNSKYRVKAQSTISSKK